MPWAGEFGPNPRSVAYFTCTAPMAPGLVAILPATPLVVCWSRPPGRPGQFEFGEVGLMATPSVGPPDWWICWLAKAAHRAGCSAMHHSSSTKLVPAESLSVTALMVRLGSVMPGLSLAMAASFQLVMPPVRTAHAV